MTVKVFSMLKGEVCNWSKCDQENMWEGKRFGSKTSSKNLKVARTAVTRVGWTNLLFVCGLSIPYL